MCYRDDIKAELSLSDGAVERTEKSLSSTSLQQITGFGLEGRLLLKCFRFHFLLLRYG